MMSSDHAANRGSGAVPSAKRLLRGPRRDERRPGGNRPDELEPGTPLFPDVGIIVLPSVPWIDTWRPANYVAQSMARYFHVHWVNPAQEWREAVWRMRKSPRSTWYRPVPGVTVQNSEPWLPRVYTPSTMGRLLRRARLRRARRRLQKMGCTKILLYLWRPEYGYALDAIPHDGAYFHIDDEYSFVDHEVPNKPAEVEVIRAADGVFVHSPALMEKKGGINPNTVLVPNGVVFEAVSRVGPEPADLRSVPGPRIGYMGYLKPQLDWQLLEALATMHPEWSFVFVGGEDRHPGIRPVLDRMGSRPNVHMLGEKATAEIVAYPHHFDVCVMPYRMMPYTNYIYPLKLHEYLATGKPVVSTPIRSMRSFSEVVQLAATVEEWSRALAQALEPKALTPARVEERKEIAREHDWDALTDRIARVMAGSLGSEYVDRMLVAR